MQASRALGMRVGRGARTVTGGDDRPDCGTGWPLQPASPPHERGVLGREGACSGLRSSKTQRGDSLSLPHCRLPFWLCDPLLVCALCLSTPAVPPSLYCLLPPLLRFPGPCSIPLVLSLESLCWEFDLELPSHGEGRSPVWLRILVDPRTEGAGWGVF